MEKRKRQNPARSSHARCVGVVDRLESRRIGTVPHTTRRNARQTLSSASSPCGTSTNIWIAREIYLYAFESICASSCARRGSMRWRILCSDEVSKLSSCGGKRKPIHPQLYCTLYQRPLAMDTLSGVFIVIGGAHNAYTFAEWPSPVLL